MPARLQFQDYGNYTCGFDVVLIELYHFCINYLSCCCVVLYIHTHIMACTLSRVTLTKITLAEV